MKCHKTRWFNLTALAPVPVSVEVFADLTHEQAEKFALDLLNEKGLEHYPSHSGFFTDHHKGAFSVFPISRIEADSTGPGEQSNTDGDVPSDNLTGGPR